MIVIYCVWLQRHREIARTVAFWDQAQKHAAERAGAVHAQLTAAQDSVWQALYAQVNINHMHYEVGNDQLPGVLTVKCLDCEETIGTTAGKEPPLPLVEAHVQQKFEELCLKAGEVVTSEVLKYMEHSK